MLNFQKEWQVEVQGQVYEANFDELKQWIEEGAVLPADRVKKKNLRWIAAEKVPELCVFFISRESEIDFTSISETDNSDSPAEQLLKPEEPVKEADPNWGEKVEKVCHLHAGREYAYACDVCEHYFCKSCPKSYGGSVRICPLCNSLCRSVHEPVDIHKSVGAINKPYLRVDKNTDEEKQTRKRFQILNFGKVFSYSVTFLKSVIEEAKLFVFSRISKSQGR